MARLTIKERKEAIKKEVDKMSNTNLLETILEWAEPKEEILHDVPDESIWRYEFMKQRIRQIKFEI